ncbi:MAG: GxxExxY protein [Pirellulaceae bacterium]|jgi:hypothetical protein|nr:GxxExxY protein [Pirellulaceae bacterium]
MEFDGLSNRVISCAIEVHRELSPGLLESTYKQCLAHELKLSGIVFQLQHPQSVQYKGKPYAEASARGFLRTFMISEQFRRDAYAELRRQWPHIEATEFAGAF